MILKGSQRGGAAKLANHLLRKEENDHVTLHELRGFSADDLQGALQEADAVAKGTRCRQFLFSLSLNPPETEHASVADFEEAIDQAEIRLGLQGQPRAIVFHEKEGRRHAHAVWSRIDVDQMKAINLPFYKTRLKEVSKALFLSHDWRLPDGFRDHGRRHPLNFTQAEWQQAKRVKQDTQVLKMTFQECWAVSDNRATFERALEDKGYSLAKGDRRGFVAVDYRGEVYSLSRWTGMKTKALKDKLDDPDDLPDVGAVKETIAARMTETLRGFIRDTEDRAESQGRTLMAQKAQMKTRQRASRQTLINEQSERADQEALIRATRFRSGVGGLWDRITGKARKTRQENERAAEVALARDAVEKESLISAQLSERRVLQQDIRQLKRAAARDAEELRKDMAVYLGMRQTPDAPEANQRGRAKDRSTAPRPSR